MALYNTHNPFNGPFSGTALVSRYQKGKTNLDRLAVASVGPYASLHLAPDRLPCQHPTTQFFTDRMPFLPPNQQRQSTVTCDKLRAIIMSYLLMLVKVMFLPTVFFSLFASRITQRVMCKNL